MKAKVRLFAATVFLGAAAIGFGQPQIIGEPQSTTNVLGTTAIITVTASGTEPLAYQWQRLSNDWLELATRTNASLVLTNVQAGDRAGYRVVVSNVEGAVTSQVAQLTVVSPPKAYISSPALYQTTAVYRRSNISLARTASGTPPVSYQWRLDGMDLPEKTNQTIKIASAEPADEGNYSAVVANPWGAVTSAPVRLYVTPAASSMIHSDFTNAAKLRLPYWYLLPEVYDPAVKYPLVCVLHGTPGGEDYFQTYADIGPQALGLVFESFRQQMTNPAILVWPARRSGDDSWTAQYVQQILGLLDHLSAEFSVDANRIYIGGMSEGVHAVWDCLGSQPGFFAGGMVLAGASGSSSASSVARVPLWAFCALDDSASFSMTALVLSLRRAGGTPIYTQYATGGHMDGIAHGLCTPQAVDWLLSQRRGQPSTNEPLLTIINPTSTPLYSTAASAMDLSGQATAYGEAITAVWWTNSANGRSGAAQGTSAWTATRVPLQQGKTNLVVVVATTTSWARGLGGMTTFSDSLSVASYPIRATLTAQGAGALLNWIGGGSPYSVQYATNAVSGTWVDYLQDATAPVLVPVQDPFGFYRILGH